MATFRPTLIGATTYWSLALLDGKVLDGRWHFVSDGGGCMYPRFVDETSGIVVPFSAVAVAYPAERN